MQLQFNNEQTEKSMLDFISSEGNKVGIRYEGNKDNPIPAGGCAGYIYEIEILETEIECDEYLYLGSHYSTDENVTFDPRCYETSSKNPLLHEILNHPSTKAVVRCKEWYQDAAYVPVRESQLLCQVGQPEHDKGAMGDSRYFNGNNGMLTETQDKMRLDLDNVMKFAKTLTDYDKHNMFDAFFGSRKVVDLYEKIKKHQRIQTRPIEKAEDQRKIGIRIKLNGIEKCRRVIILLDYLTIDGQKIDAILDGSTTIQGAYLIFYADTGSSQKERRVEKLNTIELPPSIWKAFSPAEIRELGLDLNPEPEFLEFPAGEPEFIEQAKQLYREGHGISRMKNSKVVKYDYTEGYVVDDFLMLKTNDRKIIRKLKSAAYGEFLQQKQDEETNRINWTLLKQKPKIESWLSEQLLRPDIDLADVLSAASIGVDKIMKKFQVEEEKRKLEFLEGYTTNGKVSKSGENKWNKHLENGGIHLRFALGVYYPTTGSGGMTNKEWRDHFELNLYPELNTSMLFNGAERKTGQSYTVEFHLHYFECFEKTEL